MTKNIKKLLIMSLPLSAFIITPFIISSCNSANTNQKLYEVISENNVENKLTIDAITFVDSSNNSIEFTNLIFTLLDDNTYGSTSNPIKNSNYTFSFYASEVNVNTIVFTDSSNTTNTLNNDSDLFSECLISYQTDSHYQVDSNSGLVNFTYYNSIFEITNLVLSNENDQIKGSVTNAINIDYSLDLSLFS